MQSEIRIVVTVTVFYHNIMADLKTNAVPVVVPSGDAFQSVSIAILEKDAAPEITVQILIVFAVAIESQIFDDHVGCPFAREQWEK